MSVPQTMSHPGARAGDRQSLLLRYAAWIALARTEIELACGAHPKVAAASVGSLVGTVVIWLLARFMRTDDKAARARDGAPREKFIAIAEMLGARGR